MFKPPRCPHRECQYHRSPEEGFCQFFGFYSVKCRPDRVPRFRCRGCKRTFSRQTFRMDYRDHRPDVNFQVMTWLSSGVGLRQFARQIPIDRKSLRRKVWKIGLHLRKVHKNLSARAQLGDSKFQLDELETFEGKQTESAGHGGQHHRRKILLRGRLRRRNDGPLGGKKPDRQKSKKKRKSTANG